MIFEKIEIKAKEILGLFGVSSMPVPVEEIASKLGIKISRGSSRDFSGLLIRKDGNALIGVNSDEAPVRQRFTIAHELGHFFLHPQKDAFVDYRDNKEKRNEAIMRTPRERQANMFAAALLMPKALLQKDVQSFSETGFTEDEIRTLSRKYLVSEDAMRFRLLNLHFKK